jgi:hypothetical protein
MTGTAPPPPQIPAGWQPLPADMDYWIGTPLEYLVTRPAFRAQMEAPVSLAPGGFTVIPLDTILEDPYGGWSASGISWTCPNGCAGWYDVTLTAATASMGAFPSELGAGVWVDGSQYAQLSLTPGVNGNSASSSASLLVPLNPGD